MDRLRQEFERLIDNVWIQGEKAADAMGRIASDLLLLARSDVDQLPLKPSTILVGELLQRAAASVQGQGSPQIRVDVEPEQMTVAQEERPAAPPAEPVAEVIAGDRPQGRSEDHPAEVEVPGSRVGGGEQQNGLPGERDARSLGQNDQGDDQVAVRREQPLKELEHEWSRAAGRRRQPARKPALPVPCLLF